VIDVPQNLPDPTIKRIVCKGHFIQMDSTASSVRAHGHFGRMIPDRSKECADAFVANARTESRGLCAIKPPCFVQRFWQ